MGPAPDRSTNWSSTGRLRTTSMVWWIMIAQAIPSVAPNWSPSALPDDVQVNWELDSPLLEPTSIG